MKTTNIHGAELSRRGFLGTGGALIVGFRLLQPPFSLSQTLVGFVFLLYAAGTASSSIAGWKAINESDMLIVPVPATAF